MTSPRLPDPAANLGPSPVDHQRALFDDARRDLRQAAIRAADAARAVAVLARGSSLDQTEAVRKAEANVQAAKVRVAELRSRSRGARTELASDLRRAIAPSAEEEVARLSPEYPILLLPVRIETRFVGDELLLRVYPDEIVADSFEPELTDEEIADGKAFWDGAWPGDAEERLAWKALVTALGPSRAAWVASAMTPTNLDARPHTPPVYPTPARRESSWTRPAEARLLPDRWHVRLEGLAGERIVSGGAIHEPLTLTFSPDPGDPTEPLGDDGLRLTADTKWTVNFEAAVAVGMALRIPLRPSERDGFRRVTVFGVKSSLAPDVSASSFSELLDHHRHGRGLALLPQGTPTNNTSAATTPFPPQDADGSRSYAAERTGITAAAGRDGPRWCGALGLSNETATHFAGADGREEERARAMARALWPVTWGYFLAQMMDPVFSTENIESARQFFVNHVRGRGPYSAFRVGNTPYGLLPVTSLAQWLPGRVAGPADQHLPEALRKLRALWFARTDAVPRVGRTGDPDQDLLEILGLDASTREVRVRPVTGEDVLWNIAGVWQWDQVWLQWLDQGQLLASQLFTLLGHPEWQPRIGRVNYDPNAWPFRYHLVTEDPASETEGLTPNYIEWIRGASFPDLMKEKVPSEWDRPVSLLYRLLRHGGLLEYDRATHRLARRFTPENVASARERELSGLAGDTINRVEQMMRPIPAVSRTAPIHTWLADPANGATLRALFPDEPVVGYRDALAALSTAPTAELERLLAETLDTASHRLDAWITALPAKRLDEIRSRRPTGMHLGAYGFVEDLRRRPPDRRPQVRRADGTSAVRQADNGGYIHAPSLSHAAAAAILRSGYLSRTGADRLPYAVDLSSARVRAARFVLDAVREGQPVGAVFGYQVERGLHDRNLDKWIAPLRARYPLVAAKTGDSEDFDPAHPDQPLDHIAARNVVDGLALRKAYQAGTVPWGQFGLPTGSAGRSGIEAELVRLDETADATSDLLLAEAVYQLVKGSPNVAAATLDAMASGAVRPPDPEVATAPRRGTPLTHRIALLLGGNGTALPFGYPAATPRAVIEPRLDAWLGQLFGPADRYSCGVEFGPPEAPTGITSVSADQLALRPIDLMLLANARGEGGPGATRAEASELDRRVLEVAHAKLGLTIETPARIQYGRPGAGFDPATDRTLTDLLELARAAREVLSRSRPLGPEDVAAEDRAEEANAADHHAADALARVEAARQDLDLRNQALATALAHASAAPDGAAFDLGALRSALRGVAALGVTGSYPVSSFGPTLTLRVELIAQAGSVTAEAIRRLTAAAGILTEAGKPEHATDDRFRLDAAREALTALCGADLPFIPIWDPPVPSELANALAHSSTGAFIDADATKQRVAVRAFEQTALRVRPGVDAWRRLEVLAGTLGRERLPRTLAQLPYDAAARWVALPFASETDRPPPGKLSLLIYQADTPAPTVPWAGLVIDQWVEMIPSPDEQTGVAFHYDDPGAEAPQTVLLAVPPVPTARNWQLDWVLATLKETTEMARIRAVDGEMLGAIAQLLPAICLADSTDDVTVRTTLFDAMRLEPVLIARA